MTSTHTEHFGTNISIGLLKGYIPKCKDCLRAFFISEPYFAISRIQDDTVMFTFVVDEDDEYIEYIDCVMIYFSAINDVLKK